MLRHPWRYLLAGLIAAWAIDFLFWSKSAGISFLIWTVVLLLSAFLLARSEKIVIPWQSWLLAGAVLVLAAVVFIRQEDNTRILSTLMALGLILLLAGTFSNGYWARFRLREYLTTGFTLAAVAVVRGFELLKPAKDAGAAEAADKKGAWRRVLPYLRGLLLAVPVLLVLGGLLMAADPIFSGWIEDWLKAFDLEKIGEYIFRAGYVLVLAYLFSGLFAHAVLPRPQMEKPDPAQPMLKGFLGFTETAIVLGLTNLLFAVFLIVQVRYFFGGQANITETGYTYAEYARRGFGELLTVAVLSLLLYLGLSVVSKLESRASQRGFTVLALLLFAQVMVMMISAYQRLTMYEQAYGLTRDRISSHTFLFWLGALLIAVIALELLKKRGWILLAGLIAAFGFTVTLAGVNVDGQILRQNIARAFAPNAQETASWNEEPAVDAEYLKTLSTDAVPIMAEMYQTVEDPQTKETLAILLACQQKSLEKEEDHWQSVTWSKIAARRTLAGMQETLGQYPLVKEDWVWVYKSGNQVEYCQPWYVDYDIVD
jgi:hypothetical protein